MVQQQKTTSVKSMVVAAMLSATVSALTLMVTKNKTRSKDFQPRMGLREEGKKKRNMGDERRMWKGWYINQRDFFL